MPLPIKDSKILVTGGAGFVGSYVLEHLLAQDAGKIIVVDNLFRGTRENIQASLATGKVELVEGDIRDRALVHEQLKGVDYCFHLAALRITHCAEKPREALEIMYDGTFNVLEACVEHKIKKMILASSASIYGQATSFPTNEEHNPYHNYTLYGAAKMANELMCRSFKQTHKLSFNALRYFNIYGPRMDTVGKYTEVLIRWYRLIAKGEAPIIFGKGDQTMDFIYIDDIARATVLALTAPVDGEVFNIAYGEETSLEELCYLLLNVMGSDLKPQYVPVPEDRQKVEVMRRLADVSKAERMIGFKASVGLEEGLRRLVAWLQKQEEAVAV